MTQHRRIKFLSDEIGNLLKQIPFLGDRIAVSSQEDPMKFYQQKAKMYPHRNFYPTNKSLQGFCNKAYKKLAEMGVEFKLGKTVQEIKPHKNGVKIKTEEQEVEVDYLFWASPQEFIAPLFGVNNNLRNYIAPVPMILYYFVVNRNEISDYTYIHNFNKEQHIFRVSFPSNYHSQVVKGDKVYICCEIPKSRDSPLWEQPEIFADQI
jgi:protoporphyrinogen oxidase